MDDKTQAAIERGHQAEQLLKSAAFERAWQRVRQGVHERWALSPITDKDGQHELRLLIKVMDDIEGNLHQEMQSGLMAQAQLRKEQDLAQARKDRTAQYR